MRSFCNKRCGKVSEVKTGTRKLTHCSQASRENCKVENTASGCLLLFTDRTKTQDVAHKAKIRFLSNEPVKWTVRFLKTKERPGLCIEISTAGPYMYVLYFFPLPCYFVSHLAGNTEYVWKFIRKGTCSDLWGCCFCFYKTTYRITLLRSIKLPSFGNKNILCVPTSLATSDIKFH